MANKRIRVYELARELGLSNKEALDLCERLRIGVKSHSSSIEDPQADRVRRLADAEGLRRPTQPDAEPEPAAAPSAPAGDGGAAPEPAPEPVAPVHRVIRSTEGGARLAPRPEAPQPPPPPRAPMPERVQPIQPQPGGPGEAPFAERPAAEAPRPAAAASAPAPPATGPGAPGGGRPAGPGDGAPGAGRPGGGLPG